MSPALKSPRLRRILILAGLLPVLSVAGAAWLLTGRFIATDNAYVKAAKIMVTPEVSGRLSSVAVGDNQKVAAGALLFTIEDAPYRIALGRAEADLATAGARIAQLKAQYRQKLEEFAAAEVESNHATAEFRRQDALARAGTVSRAHLDDMRRARDVAARDMAELAGERDEILAALGDPEVRAQDHPLYLAAAAALESARLDLARTQVRAPTAGTVGGAPHAGDYAHAGVPLMGLVASDAVWIEANYKETELTHMKVGQAADFEIDTYPGRHFTGEVESISPATGSEFAILPAQNATGNWVKVVQRIGVRLAVRPGADAPPLRAGMSVHAEVDTGHYPHLPALGFNAVAASAAPAEQ